MANDVLSFSSALAEEARAVGLAMKRYISVWAVLMGFVCIMTLRATLAWNRVDGQFIPVALHPSVIALPLMLFGLIAPLSVWRDEQPRRRAYLYSLPVVRKQLQGIKGTAGWLWVMGAGLVLTLAMWMLTVIANAIGGNGAVSALPPRSMLNQFEGAVPGWQWAIPFVAGTIAYLIGTVPALLSNSPSYWIIGGFISLITLMVVGDSGSAFDDLAETIFDGIFGSSYGIPSLLGITDPLTLSTWSGAILLWGSAAILGAAAATQRYFEP